ncbi:MAG TPA: hypothetical protein DHV49_04180 [Alphaproteobacteria bacterium]|nr:hypothetical protein [Alphaproteobacteria bacterium]|tara:strand:+ start:1500 stop:2729 length:1230 start_codon:yes stop_codon:yes gene_type:complete
MMFSCKNICALLGILLGLSGHAYANDLGIVAVVNDEAISNVDLNQRSKLLQLGAGPNPSQEILNTIRRSALDALINEALIRQELQRLNLKVDEKNIENSLRGLEERNNIPSGKIADALASQGVNIASLKAQIAGELGMVAIARRLFARDISVSQTDIAGELSARIRARESDLVALRELVLDADDSRKRQQAIGLARNIIGALKAQNAPFAAAASRFSTSLSARNGGNLGLVDLSTYPTELAGPIAEATPGQIVGPLYFDNKVYLYQVSQRGRDPLLEALGKVGITYARLTSKTASDITDYVANNTPDAICSGKVTGDQNLRLDIEETSLSALPPRQQSIIAATPEGSVTRLLSENNLHAVYVLCARRDSEEADEAITRFGQSIADNRIRTKAERHRLDLKRTARIDLRG